MLHKSKPKLYIQFYKNIKIPVSESIYLCAFSLYLIIAVLKTTMFTVYISDNISLIFSIISSILIFTKIILFDEYTKKQLLMIILLGISMIFSWIKSDYNTVINLMLFIIGANNVSPKRIIKVSFYITVTLVIVSMISAQLGIIEQLTYYRNGKKSYAFGSVYCTDFAAHVFYLIISYCYIKFDKLLVRHILIFLLLGGFVYYYCRARLDSLSIVITSIVFLYLINKKRLYKNITFFNPIIRLLLIFSVSLCAFISIFITSIYNVSNSKMSLLNDILSDRLNLGKIGIEKYGFKPFGQQVFMVGFGGTNDTSSVSNYFFIDCSYLNVALRFGMVILIMLCIYYTFVIRKMLKNDDFLTPIVIFIIAINSIVAQHFIELAYNPFILILFTSIEYNEFFVFNTYRLKLKKKICLRFR